jgi:hypothetical protein
LVTISTHVKPQFIATHNSKKSSNNAEWCAFLEKLPSLLPGTVFISLEHPLAVKPECMQHQRHAATLSEALELILEGE